MRYLSLLTYTLALDHHIVCPNQLASQLKNTCRLKKRKVMWKLTLLKDSCLHNTSHGKWELFLHIPLEDQWKQLLGDREIHEHLTNRSLAEILKSSVLYDITTAKLCKNLIRNHAMSKNDISWHGTLMEYLYSRHLATQFGQFNAWSTFCLRCLVEPSVFHNRFHTFWTKRKR